MDGHGIRFASAIVLLSCAGAGLAQSKAEIDRKSQAAKQLQTVPRESATAAEAVADRQAAAQALAEAKALRSTNEKLTKDYQSLVKANEALARQVNALASTNGGLKTATDKERNGRQLAEQDARNQRAVNEELQKEKKLASELTSELQARADALVSSLAQAREGDKRLTNEVSAQRQQLVDAARHAGELDRTIAAQKDELAANGVRIAALEDGARKLGGDLDSARRQRWQWAAALAATAALLSALAVRLWWPKPIHHVKPVSLSVSFGRWTLAAPQFASTSTPNAAFKIRTQWLPGTSTVRGSALLAKNLRTTARQGSAT